MNKKVFTLLLLNSFFAAVLSGQIILKADERETLLADSKAVIGNTGKDAVSADGIISPFIKKRRPAPEPESVITQVEEDPEAPLPEVLADEVALNLIGRQFKPLGSLVMGDKGILQLERGRTIGEGETIKAEIKGRTYEVIIDSVTSSGYRLRLGDATLDKSFINVGSSPTF